MRFSSLYALARTQSAVRREALVREAERAQGHLVDAIVSGFEKMIDEYVARGQFQGVLLFEKAYDKYTPVYTPPVTTETPNPPVASSFYYRDLATGAELRPLSERLGEALAPFDVDVRVLNEYVMVTASWTDDHFLAPDDDCDDCGVTL